MNLAVSSPYTKEVITGPYLQPCKTSSVFVIQLHISSHLRLGHLSGLFPFGVPTAVMPPCFTSSMRAYDMPSHPPFLITLTLFIEATLCASYLFSQEIHNSNIQNSDKGYFSLVMWKHVLSFLHKISVIYSVKHPIYNMKLQTQKCWPVV
jgi:hypothetical protein